MDEDLRARRILRITIALIVFLGIIFGARRIILGNAQVIKLGDAPALSSQISQALGPDASGNLLRINKDYTISVKKFADPDWLVAYIKPVSRGGTAQNAYVTLRKSQGIFQVVTGPGTTISNTQLYALPVDVVGYLEARMAVYSPIVGNN